MTSMSGAGRVEGVGQKLSCVCHVCVLLKSWEGGRVDRRMRGQLSVCVVWWGGRGDADFMHH